jgi:ADP-ribosylglycohydrolase
MQSIVTSNMQVNIVDFAHRLRTWMDQGFPECNDKGGLGIGMTVYSVLTHPQFLMNPKIASKDIWEKYGRDLAANGAVMRTAILGILNFDNIDRVIQNTIDICQVTHADPRCLASCVTITTSIALLLQGNSDVNDLLESSRNHALKVLNDYQTDARYIDEFNYYFDATTIDQLELSQKETIGYTYKCFACGILALRLLSQPDNTMDYKDLFNKIAYKGGDADTNLAVTGAIVGAYLGYDHLDQKWIQQFPYKTFLDRIVIQFCEKLGFDVHVVEKKLGVNLSAKPFTTFPLFID